MLMLDTCPACARTTVLEEHDICEYCRWHDDYVQRRFPYSYGANHMALADFQAQLRNRLVPLNDECTEPIGQMWKPIVELPAEGYFADLGEQKVKRQLFDWNEQFCPRCGFVHPTHPGTICPRCGWVDDPWARLCPWLKSTPNRMSLAEAHAAAIRAGSREAYGTENRLPSFELLMTALYGQGLRSLP